VLEGSNWNHTVEPSPGWAFWVRDRIKAMAATLRACCELLVRVASGGGRGYDVSVVAAAGRRECGPVVYLQLCELSAHRDRDGLMQM